MLKETAINDNEEIEHFELTDEIRNILNIKKVKNNNTTNESINNSAISEKNEEALMNNLEKEIANIASERENNESIINTIDINGEYVSLNMVNESLIDDDKNNELFKKIQSIDKANEKRPDESFYDSVLSNSISDKNKHFNF